MKFDKLRLLTDAAEYARKGKVDQAIAAYRAVIDEQPDEIRAYLKIGDLLARKDSAAEAANTYLYVADHYTDHGFDRKAIAVYRRVLELQPERLDVHLQLAQAQVEQDPDNVSLRLYFAELLTEKSRITEACEELELAASKLRFSGQTDAFLLVNEKRLALQPDNTPLRRELAGVYLRRDMPHHALGLIGGCYQVSASEPPTLSLLAKIFLAMNQEAEAINAFKALAEVHDCSGQKSLRDRALHNVLELNPEDADALTVLGSKAVAPTRPEPAPTVGSQGRFGSVDLTQIIDDLVTRGADDKQITLSLDDASPPSPAASTTAQSAVTPTGGSSTTEDLAELLEPNWLEPDLVVAVDES